jgi:phenylacetate-CoA ligase
MLVADSWLWDETRIRQWQLQQLNAQLAAILPLNRFYSAKFGAQTLQLQNLDELAGLPLTTKQELVASAAESQEGISAHHTYESSRYSRIHRTSGTTGSPLLVLDTANDWEWWSATWQHVLEAAAITTRDRIFMAFSFGPFIGFWSAHQACVDRGATVIPGGGLTSLARLEFMRQSQATVMCCTPSYALHLAEVARRENFAIDSLSLKTLIVAGEAGGSIPAVRSLIEETWQAHVVDHSGATEIGPWGFGWPDRPGLHIIETSFIAEFLPSTGAGNEMLSELVLTSLGRTGAPVIRYRTGDIVRVHRPAEGPCRFLWLPQGVVGRADNMVTIRGVNIFPSSIDALIRQFPAVSEFRVIVTRREHLDQLELEIEASEATKADIEKQLTSQLGLRISVKCVTNGTLPRHEGKAQRWQDDR